MKPKRKHKTLRLGGNRQLGQTEEQVEFESPTKKVVKMSSRKIFADFPRETPRKRLIKTMIKEA